MSYIVIAGGGKSQVPFIQAALNLGFGTIVFDMDENAPGAKIASLFIRQSIRDEDPLFARIMTLSKDYDLAGVMTYSANEHTLGTIAQTTERLRFPSYSSTSLANIADKARTKQCFKQAQVPSPKGIATSDVEDALSFFKSPSVVKPSKGAQGSQGVALVHNADELRVRFQNAQTTSSNATVIVEEFVDGIEYSVDGIVISGQPHILSLSRKSTLGGEHGFVMSGFHTTEDKPEIETVACDAVHAIGLDHSLFSVDVLDTDEGLCVIECGVMLDCKIDRLLALSGIDIYTLFIQMITGKASPPQRLPAGYEISFLFAKTSGTLSIYTQDIEGLEWEQSNGAKVGPPTSIADTLGWIVGTTEHVSAIKERSQALFEVT